MNPISKALDWLVSLVADKVLAGSWLRITKRAREEGRGHDAAAARVERLREALGILAEGLAMNLGTSESATKIAQAVNELQTEGPVDVDGDLERVVEAVSKTVQSTYTMSQLEIHQLMKPIRAKVGPMVGKRG